MNKSMRKQRKPMADINVVPYIDVMLVLLVIFMITAPLLSQGVNVDLPSAQAQSLAQQKEPIIVSVDASGQYYLNISHHPEQPLDSASLEKNVAQELELAKQQGQPRSVFVKGDKQVAYEKIVAAMVLLQHAGAASVGLITQDPGTDL